MAQIGAIQCSDWRFRIPPTASAEVTVVKCGVSQLADRIQALSQASAFVTIADERLYDGSRCATQWDVAASRSAKNADGVDRCRLPDPDVGQMRSTLRWTGRSAGVAWFCCFLTIVLWAQCRATGPECRGCEFAAASNTGFGEQSLGVGAHASDGQP